MYDVAIIGAGVVGGLLARKLSAYKLKVCILEKENDVAMGATKANSAIVHAGFDAEPGTLKASLNVKGSMMMEKIARELGVKYKKNGSLVIGFDEKDKEVLESLLERGQKNGVQGLKLLGKEEVHALEKNLSEKVQYALHAPSGAIICPYELTVAAIGNAMDNGADLKCNFEVTDICKNGDAFAVSSKTDWVQARFVVNAAGLYSDEIAKLAGDFSIEVHPRKGEYILLDKGEGSLLTHTVFRTPSEKGKGILVTPTVDNNLLLGPTSVDRMDKADAGTTREGFAKILKEASENVDGIPFNKAITSFCGLRAAGNTGDFIIRSPQKGFINVAGIESPGLSASPAIAEFVADMLKEQGLAMDEKENFNPVRRPMHAFREASTEEKNKMIKQNPAYGKIVCRCEKVSEGEILDALRFNPKATDLDGVKRRTRAQMGRCQGGFCGPYIVELIAKETGVAYEKVTKFGGESFINFGKTKEV
ncbi:MAG: NAD(P)/FAD-dependent oxidoreductase [Clostridia bacterium]|nr:NAD(P)/FAD-dependent oxidoreductase [Clostridia bacterium]